MTRQLLSKSRSAPAPALIAPGRAGPFLSALRHIQHARNARFACAKRPKLVISCVATAEAASAVALRPDSAVAPLITNLDSKNAKVLFKLGYEVQFGQTVRLIGSHPSLGSWQLDKAPVMEWSPGHVWVHTAELPAGSVVEYKYVVTQHGAFGGQSWQSGNNSVLAVSPEEDNVTVVDNWASAPGAVVVIDDSKELTKEDKLQKWASEMLSYRTLAIQKDVELARARDEVKALKSELARLHMELSLSNSSGPGSVRVGTGTVDIQDKPAKPAPAPSPFSFWTSQVQQAPVAQTAVSTPAAPEPAPAEPIAAAIVEPAAAVVEAAAAVVEQLSADLASVITAAVTVQDATTEGQVALPAERESPVSVLASSTVEIDEEHRQRSVPEVPVVANATENGIGDTQTKEVVAPAAAAVSANQPIPTIPSVPSVPTIPTIPSIPSEQSYALPAEYYPMAFFERLRASLGRKQAPAQADK